MARTLKKMLIAIEDGRSDEQVVDAGLDLAVDEGAEVIFVHVGVSIPGESFVPTGEVARVPDRATDEVLVGACEKAHERGLEATSELLIGYPARQLALVADDLDVDLIVVGSRRLSALKRAVLGSTSRALLTESSRQVLVVPLTTEQPALEATPA
jgi:nucleotide-binding universal stress UspA family protein